jgi:LPXTG-site transpeptidase (sortase) family protein
VITDGGRTITWNLGTVTNSNSDNSTPETITITYTVQALNVSSSQHGSSLDNSVEISWEALDSEGSTVTLTEGPVNADAVAVIEPQIDVSKTVVVGGAGNTGDAGDSVEYTITFAADASRPTAYEADLSDFLPIDIDFSSGSYGISGVTDSEGILNIASFEITPGRELRLLNDNPIVMAPGRSVTITLTGELEDTVFTGQTIINTAQMTWSSQTGDQSSGAEDGERDGSDGVGGLNDYQSPNSATINVIDPSPGKIIVSTSEDHTGTISGTPRLVIGEILRYRIEVRLAEGTSNDMILRDNLPAGLVFLNDSTARVVFVADTPANITSSSPPNSDPPGIVDAGAFVSGDETSVSGITPTVVLGDENISSTLGGNNDSYGSGQDVYFKLGDVFNSEADLNSEFAVIEFNALVANVLGNQRGTTRNNSFTVYVDEDGDGDAESNEDIETSSPVSVVIAEPTLSVTKTILTAPSDAGDPITYQLVISNPDNGNNDAAGFDLVLTDTFDSYLGSLSIDPVATTQGGTCLGNGSGTTAYSDDGGSFTGQVLTFTASCLDQSQTITLTINAVLANDIPAGYDLQNTANLTWTSLPGGKGTASNPTGSDVDDAGTTEDESGGSRGERNGSESPVVNDYTTPGSENLVLDVPLVNKTVSPLGYAVGEVITYNVVITLPEGITPDMVFHDDLPTGLEYLSHDVIISAAASGGALSNDFNGSFTNDYTNPAFITAPGGSGGDLSIVFGTTDTVADNNSNNDSFLIRITARLLNEIGNQYPDLLTNAAEIQYSSGTTATGSVDVMVIEPVVSLDKTSAVVTPASGTATLGAVIEYTLALSNPSATSSAAAFDMVLTDTIPTGMTYVPGSISAPAGWTADDSSAPGLTWTSNSGTSLALNATVSFTYRATIDSPGMPNEPSPGQILTNAVDLVWTSLDGPSTEERDGTDGPGGFLNDYAVSTDEDITVENIDLRIEKDDGGVSFDAGDIVVYDLNSYNDGSIDATGVVITETVPVNTTFDLAGSSGVWSCPDNSPAGTVCTQTLGTVSPSVGVPTVVQFAVAIDNPLPAAVTTITNNVSIADDGSNGPEPTPGNNSDSVITPSIGANPDLTITKDDGIEIGAPGTGMVYTLVYENVGTQDATGVVITETVSTGVTFDLGNSTPGWVVQGTGVPAVDGEPAGTVLEFEIGNVNAGDAPVSIDFAVVVDNPLAAGITEITNTASIADDGSNGPDLTPDDNSDDDVDGIAVQGKDLDSQLHGVTTLPDVAIGEILTYEVVLTVPDGSMPGLHLVDSLDRGLGFVDCESISATGLTTTVVGGFSTICSSPAVSELPVGSAAEEDQGRQIDFDFGTLANNTGNAVDLVLRYQVAVLDSINNQSDSTPPLNNQAEWAWDSGSLSDQAVGVTILEPDLNLQKNASPTVLYPGQITTFTLVVDHDAGSQTPAYNLVLTDIIPEGLIYQPPIRYISGQAPTNVDDAGSPTLILEWDVFLNNGQNSVIEIDVMLDPDFRRTHDKQTITNDASLSWTSLPGDFSAPQSAYNDLSTERYYDPLSNVDIYQAADDARIRIPALPDTGFAPGRITEIPLKFPEQTYEEMSGLVLEIPALELTLPIVSVPITSQGYDLTWLSSQAGWLEGSAYPSWVGNTVITGHAYLSSGLPGPFVDLEKLSWGDDIILEANGLEYTYQVREKALVSGDNLSILGHKDQDWLTLFTCKDFSEELGQYRWRQVVEAVLISVEDIP